MKTLIYTVAYGGFPFVDMAENLERTARVNGYSGDFLVFGEEHCLPGMPKAALIRALSRERVESYDKILFVDSDCVFLEDPTQLFRPEGIALVVVGGRPGKYNSVFLTEDERQSARAEVHSGAFLLPGKGAYEFLSAWESVWLNAPRDEVRGRTQYSWVPPGLMDQPALQAFLARNEIPYSRLEGMRFPLSNPESEGGIVAHFCGDVKAGGHVDNKIAVWNSMQERTSKVLEARIRNARIRKQGENMFLIYSFCFGDAHYFHSAQEMIFSVRKQGFAGRVLILTDRPWTFDGADTQVVNHEKGRLWKSAILQAVRAEEYEKILYLDSDILCVKPLDWIFRYENIAVATASTLLHLSPGTAHYMTESERNAAQTLGVYGINTGAILFPGKVAREFLTRWETLWQLMDKSNVAHLWEESTDHQLLDESVLQAIYFRREYTIELIPQEKMLFPALFAVPGYSGHRLSEKTAWIHFLSTSTKINSKESILAAMKRSQDPKELPAVIAELEEKSKLLLPQNHTDVLLKLLQNVENGLKDLDARLNKLEQGAAVRA